uniref:Melanoma associated antigen (Mutated) 1 n=1 Tax=Hypotaenidia okinawae TaxID=2861861 RepID=A0A6G1S1Q5_9GRUI
MTDQKYVLCMWKKRLWPAEVLSKTGAAEGTSFADDEKAFLKVEILGVKEQMCVSCADAVPLKEECIENIASNLDQNPLSEAVEELKYRCSLKIALDILSQNAPSTKVPPLEEEPRTQLPQDDTGSLPSARLHGCQVPFHSKGKLELETSKRKREQKSNQRLKKTKKQTQKGSLILEESAKAYESGTDLSQCGTGDSCDDTSNSNSQNCKIPVSKSLLRQKKINPKLLTESKAGNEVSLKPREGVLLSAPCKPNTVVPGRRANSRAQPRRMLDSPCKSVSDDSERSIGGASRCPAKQVDGRRKPVSLKHVNGEQQGSATACSCRKKRCKNCSGSSSGPSKKLMLPDSSPSQEKKEKEETSCVAMSKAKHFQLPNSEEDERPESPKLSSKRVSLESLSRLSTQMNEEEDDEELPSILSFQEPQSIEEGILVWCKLRRYPYWPAVVKYVKHKTRKACVLLIDGNIDDKKRGFSVSLRNLKHFDCEERQDLIEQAKEDYRQEIEWCIRLICDYRVRVGCHSFTGSFLEYFADDISYPVRKEGYPGVVQGTFPNMAEDVQESPSETSPQKPSKKLLPDRMRAARDNANKKIVDFIVKTKGAEEHLLAILKSRKQSQWLKRFLNSSQYLTCIETYLEDEEQLDLVVNYLKEVYHKKGIKHLHHGDEIKFISDVLLPEAIIYAISAVDNIDYKAAEEKYIKGPSVSKREREIFDERIRERKKCKTKAAPADSV